MRATDFEYDNQCLSDRGFIICDFDLSNGVNEVDAGSTITFNKVARNKGKQNSLTSTQYDECITATFDICKDPSIYDVDEMEISTEEFRDIMRWLNRKEFLKFHIIDNNDDFEQDSCYYNASFNINKIEISKKLYGLRLKLETDCPFGYGREQITSWIFGDVDDIKILNDMSDEIGYIYPTVIITCNKDGDISLCNETENCTTSIRNCRAGEVITLHGDTQIISTTCSDHDICNDFNYVFFRIGNTLDNRVNRIYATSPCSVVIRYVPIIKIAP